MKEEYRVYWSLEKGEVRITVMKRSTTTHLPYLQYLMRGDADVIERNLHELKAVLDLVGEKRELCSFADLDRESILAVVPQWEKIL
ncbi:hypothetical protein D3C87_1133500 [compost metagenome]